MSIFWRSKEGTASPEGAAFSFFPFDSTLPVRIQQRRDSLPPPAPPIPVLLRMDSPSRSEWKAHVERALEKIERGEIKKIVLARETTLYLERAPDPFAVASSLQEKTCGASLFCLQIDPSTAFVSASPERLFCRSGQRIETDALAGTKKRGAPLDLLRCEKTRREFQFVQDYLSNQLAPLCRSEVEFSPLATHKTATVEHLYSKGVSALKAGVGDYELVAALHPTPALLGTPRREAFEWLKREEPFSRGLYGGIFGWATESASDWMVGIRSCLIENNKVRLYTGVGIVKGSDAAAEWDELEAKMDLYREVFLWSS